MGILPSDVMYLNVSQGEQCNIVPDNVDDIVADIAQEEKEEGLLVLTFFICLPAECGALIAFCLLGFEMKIIFLK